LVKVGAGKSGGNREEEIRGNHAQNINGYRVSHIGGFDDLVIEETRRTVINDTDTLEVVNTIDVKSLAGSIMTEAKENLATTTISGITSFKSGGKLNMKSAAAMVIKSESTTDWTSAGLVTETFQASHTNNTTGTLDLNVSTEVDIDSTLINLN